MISRIASFATATFAVFAAAVPAADPSPPVTLPGHYTTSWLGNSIVGANEHVPQAITGLYVAPDGTILTNAVWDEGDGEVSRFDTDGKLTGVAGHTHGWGYGGGDSITVNDKYVFFSEKVDNEGGHLVDPTTWPTAGKTWYGISRRLRSDFTKGAPFADGKGAKGHAPDKAFLPVLEFDSKRPKGTVEPSIAAIAATADRLYVADPIAGRIRVYDAEAMTLATDWVDLPRVRALALDGKGGLWAIQSADKTSPAALLHLGADGRPAAERITFAPNVEPVALAVDGRGQLIVADGGPGANILYFDPTNLAGTPTKPVRTFGQSMLAGSGPAVGQAAPARFSDLSGVGVDAQGNLYVSTSRNGAVLEKYTPGGDRAWVRYALPFVDNVSIDPLTGDLYGSEEHYKFDWSKTEPGTEWSYAGKTLDRYRYPQDVRVDMERQPLMRRLNGGRLYAFATDQIASGIYVYRFDAEKTGEIAIPCAAIVKSTIGRSNTSNDSEFLWTDSNGDGRFDPGESSVPLGRRSRLGDDCWGWWVDEGGDIWQTVNGEGPGRGLRHFPLQGFDAHGSPLYSYRTMEVATPPAPFVHKTNCGLERVVYQRAEDVMYLGGFTAEAANDGVWGSVRVVARYDHWSKGNRQATWTIQLPWKTPKAGQAGAVPIGFAVAGDYLFEVGVRTLARIRVYSVADGAYVGDLVPNNEHFKLADTGWVDIRPFGVQAMKRPDGTYAVLVEEDGRAKTIVYRWTPAK